MTDAPALVSAVAIAAPMPRAPPVTRALRPARLFSLIVCSSLCDFHLVCFSACLSTRRCLPSGQAVAEASRCCSPAWKKCRLTGMDGWTAAAALRAVPPCAQLVAAAMLGNLTLVQDCLDDRPKT